MVGSIFSIIFLVLGLVVIIARDYAFGERWRRNINGDKIDISGSPTFVDIIIWALSILGLISFLAGLFGQAFVASSVL